MVTLRLSPGAYPNDPVRIAATPAGHGFEIVNGMIGGEPGSQPGVTISRAAPAAMQLDVNGAIPANGPVVTRDDDGRESRPRSSSSRSSSALASRGITVRDGADDGDDVMRVMMVEERRVLAKHLTAPAQRTRRQLRKPSQNFYGEMFLKTIGRASARRSARRPAGRKAALEILAPGASPPMRW